MQAEDVSQLSLSPATNAGDSSPTTLLTWRSERFLDGLTFFLADVADGLGPFLVIDLTTRRDWTASQAGMAMSALLVGTIICQTFTGAWIDRTRYKRQAISIAAILVAAASVGLYRASSVAGVLSLQVLTGMAVTVFPPAIAAISLGIVGRKRLASRAGRNEAFFHAGNVASAVVALLAARLIGSMGVFYVAALMAILSATVAQFIRESDIDHNLARGADHDAGEVIGSEMVKVSSPWSLLHDRRLLWLAVSVVLFHFANAAMLPLVGQKVGHRSDSTTATSLMALCIIVAQITMVPVALLASRRAVFGRRHVFLLALFVLPIRGLLYVLTDSHWLLIGIQVLDGVAAGIFGVVVLLMIADLTQGTGRFNFAQGLMATAIGLGAAASQYLTGLIVDSGGYNAGFLFLSIVAIAASATFYFTVPETVHLTNPVRNSGSKNNNPCVDV